MNAPELEDLVARFLERRATAPELTAQSFAAEHGDYARDVVAAIQRALGVERMFGEAAPVLPDSVGAFRVVRELGRGGMGVVYEVERSGERLALKLLNLVSGTSSNALERFAREAASLARLAHSGIVAVREAGIDRGTPYIVMELVDGTPLSQIASNTSERRAAELVRDLARAVHAAHECGVLHRDLKPHNVIVRASGAPVLVDFGLVAIDDDASLTSTGAVLGTPRYMAPEQARSAPADRRTDVFGLGLILYELLCGRPARGEASREALINSAARLEVPWPRRDDRRVDRALARLAMAALAVRRERRTATAQQLADDLQRWLDGENVRARPPSWLTRAFDRGRERPAWHSVGVLGVAVLVVVLVIQLVTRDAPGERARRELDRHVESARNLLRQGQVEQGVHAALSAAASFEAVGLDAGAEVPRLLSAAINADAVRACLARLGEEHPTDALVQYTLAWSFDSAHELESAERAYLKTLTIDARHVRARLNLAHLYAGAQLGACVACDAAYAAAPRMLAPSYALDALLGALDIDRGASEFAVGRIVQTALDLARRSPEVGAPRRLLEVVEEFLESSADAPARTRLEDARQRLANAADH